MDEIAVFNRSMSQSEILAIMNDGIGTEDTSLVLGQTFDDEIETREFAYFDSSNNDYLIKSAVSSFPSTELTAMFWVKSTDSGDCILSYAAGSEYNEFGVWGSHNLQLTLENTSLATGVSINDGKWHHVAFTWRNSDDQMKLYKDGVLAFTGTLASTSLEQGGTFVVGQDQDSMGGGFQTTQAFNGNLDDLAIFNTVMTEEAIVRYMNEGGITRDSELALYYNFNAGGAGDQSGGGDTLTTNGVTYVEGGYIEDLSSYGNTGSIAGEPAIDDGYTGYVKDVTATAWVKVDEIGSEQFVIDEGMSSVYGGGLSLIVTADGKVAFTSQDSAFSAVSNEVLEAGKWYFVTGVSDSGVNKVYVNGEMSGEYTAQTQRDRDAGDLNIGYSDLSGAYFDGSIDEVSVFSRALTDDEIYDIMRSGITDEQPEYYYSLNDEIKHHEFMTFDSTDDYVMEENVTGFASTEATAMFWVKAAPKTYGGIISYASSASDNDFIVIQKYDHLALVTSGGTEIVLDADIFDNMWHHIAVTWDSVTGYVNLYKDGEHEYRAYNFQKGYSITDGGTLVIGQEQDSVGGGFDADQAFTGALDDVAVFSKVLTPEEVKAFMAVPPAGDYTDLVVHYSFDSSDERNAMTFGGTDDYIEISSSSAKTLWNDTLNGSFTLGMWLKDDSPVPTESDNYSIFYQADSSNFLIILHGFIDPEIPDPVLMPEIWYSTLRILQGFGTA